MLERSRSSQNMHHDTVSRRNGNEGVGGETGVSLESRHRIEVFDGSRGNPRCVKLFCLFC